MVFWKPKKPRKPSLTGIDRKHRTRRSAEPKPSQNNGPLTEPQAVDNPNNNGATMSEETGGLVASAAKFIVGAGILGLLLWKTPLVESLYLSLYIVLIPALFLVSIGLISQSTLAFAWAGIGDLRARVDEHITLIRNDKEAAQAA